MRTIIKHALWGTLLAGGVTLLGATAASAAETDGENGLLSGTQVIAPISAPISVVGNAISILGISAASSGSASADPPSSAQPESAQTSGSSGAGSGTQALVTIHAPIEVTGVAVAILGSSSAMSSPGNASAPATPTVSTSGAGGVLSGTQALVGIDAPITVSGNAISVLGASDVSSSGSGAAAQEAESTDAATGGAGAIAGGSQVIAPLAFPVAATGNAISLLGTSTVQEGGGEAPAQAGPASGILTTGLDGLGSGTQLLLGLSAPITIGGNAIAILGDSTVEGPGSGGGTGPGSTDPDPDGNGDPGEEPPSSAASPMSTSTLASTGAAGMLAPLVMIALLLGLGTAALLRGRRRTA